MRFYQPAYLWFLLVGLVPVLLHILMRLRVRRVRWGATYLLQRALQRLREEKKWWYYLLLAARVLVGGVVAFAFARPFLPRRDSGTFESGTAQHVLLVDDSYSMTYEHEGRTPLAQGMAMVTTLTDRWPRGEAYAVYTLAGGLRAKVKDVRFDDGRRLHEVLTGLRPRDGEVDVPRALRMLSEQHGGQAMDVVLVSDGQARNWDGLGDLRLPDEHHLLWLQPGPRAEANLAVVGLAVPGNVIVAGDSVQFIVRIQCSRLASGPQPVVCELQVPGESRQRKTDTVLPGQTREILFDVRLREPGCHAVKAGLKTHDGLAWDDTMSAGIEVREALRVGVIERDADARAFEQAIDFLALAAANGSDAGLRFSAVSGTSPGDLAGLDVVILDNPAELDDPLGGAVSAFAAHGGGVILFCGPRLLPASGGGDAALWPVRFDDRPALLPVDGARFWTLQQSSLDVRHMRALQVNDADGLTGAKIYGYWPVEPAADASVLARLDCGDPWLVGRAHGFGRVLVVTSGLSGIWNNLPVRASFLHLLHRLCAYAAEGAALPMNIERGDDVLAHGDGDTATVLLGPLGGAAQPVNLPLAKVVREGLRIQRYAGPLDNSGLYVLRSVGASGTRERFVGIYDARHESDVSALSAEQEEQLSAQLGCSILHDEAELVAYLERAGGGPELYVLLTACLLALLVAETMLSWKVGG